MLDPPLDTLFKTCFNITLLSVVKISHPDLRTNLPSLVCSMPFLIMYLNLITLKICCLTESWNTDWLVRCVNITHVNVIKCSGYGKWIDLQKVVGPPLWSSGQSSWLQIRRPGLDSRHYQKKKR
jgi:hypothetical protein